MWYLCVNTLECAQFDVVVVGALVSRERRPNLETGTFRVLGDFFLLSVLLFCFLCFGFSSSSEQQTNARDHASVGAKCDFSWLYRTRNFFFYSLATFASVFVLIIYNYFFLRFTYYAIWEYYGQHLD